MIKVFVSSTSQDLTDHRAVARNVILDMNWHPVMMEHMGSSSQATVDACLDLVSQCELFVLIVAYRQGWVPTHDQGGNGIDSVTALELKHARENNIPVLAILSNDDWPGKLWEKDQLAREWVDQFRANLNLPAVFFDFEIDASLPSFRTTLHAQMLSYRQSMIEKEVRANSLGADLEYLAEACEGMTSGNSIPFIGPFVYGDGPLSPSALAQSLYGEHSESELALTLAAEHREQRTGSRSVFLNQLSHIIREQSAMAPQCRIFDLVSSISKPWFVIYTGLDLRIENSLNEIGTPYVIVTHIGRSYRGIHDGKVLVLRQGEPAHICAADQLEVSDSENIIYRPLGSPLLHDQLDEDLELDTVVITESDHLNFLGNSYRKATQIPTRFARWLDRRPLLFLGYAMEMWHFRLVMKVFQSVGGHYRRASTFAVRKPTSPMEEIAWRRLSTKRIPIELDEFIQQVTGRDSQVTPA